MSPGSPRSSPATFARAAESTPSSIRKAVAIANSPATCSPSPGPPRAFSDPFAASRSPAELHESPEIATKYDNSSIRRASWTPTPTKTGESFRDPLRRSGTPPDGQGRVRFGPGFYIPPPGYKASSLEVPYHERMDKSGRWVADSSTKSDATKEQSASGSAETARKSECQTSAPIRSSTALSQGSCIQHPTESGKLVVWAVLACLLAALQGNLLSFHDFVKSGVSSTLGFAAIMVQLYAALISLIGLLIGSASGRQDPTESAVSSTLDGLTSLCGFIVIVGVALQLISLALYTMLVMDSAQKVGVAATSALCVVSTVVWIGSYLHRRGHACGAGRRRRRSNKSGPCGERDQTLPTVGRPPSPSSGSSHSMYIPDYDLDSDFDSNDDNPGARRPRPDWMDEALSGVIRSPLLDYGKNLR